MKTFISKFLKKIARSLNLISDKISPDPVLPHVEPTIQAIRFNKWFKDNGDKTHRINYELKEDAIVIDLGGYEGQWAADIFCKYACNIYIFEPFIEYAYNIENRFQNNSKIKIFNYGLAAKDCIEKLYISADGSSIHKMADSAVEIELKNIDNFFNNQNIHFVNLMKINIEGGEFDLLEHLIESGLVLTIENIQVQFHDFVPDAASRMGAIKTNLSKTHVLTYEYEFVWENWKIKT